MLMERHLKRHVRNNALATLLCAALATAGTAAAQGVMQQSEVAMQQFVQLSNTPGANRAQMYQALQQCCAGFVQVLKTGRQGPDYDKAKQSLTLVYPSLQQAAAYYSSTGNQTAATQMAAACVDIPMMEAFKGEQFAQDSQYPNIAYYAAGGSYNQRNYEAAARYYRAYLRTGDQAKRKNAYAYLYNCYKHMGDTQAMANAMAEAVVEMPNDYDILSRAINASLDAKDYTRLSAYVEKALNLRPNDQTLMNIKGKMLEEMGDYEAALAFYENRQRSNPQSLSLAEHVAMNHYNLAVRDYNNAALETDASKSTRLRQQSRQHFQQAANWLQQIVKAQPTSVKYNQAMAMAYNCLGDNQQLATANQRLQALNQNTVAAGDIPSQMGNGDAPANATAMRQNTRPASEPVGYTRNMGAGTGQAGGTVAQGPTAQPATPATTAASTTPHFSDYARDFIDGELKRWQAKDPYETVAEYKQRVNNDTQEKKAAELRRTAERNYINRYAPSTPARSQLQLMPYDAENQAFLIRSPYGDMVLPIARERNEARIFESNWKGVQMKNPQYYVAGDTITLASLTFVTPMGKSYTYNNKEGLEYIETNVNIDLAQIDYDKLTEQGKDTPQGGKQRIGKRNLNIGTSDVDKDIPNATRENSKTFAVVIANENYQHVPDVPLASNDGKTFMQYCIQTLGVPMRNVRHYNNAGLGAMVTAMRDIKNIADNFDGDIQVLFYYAGHGIPDEATKDAYLLPTDADGKEMAACYSLKRLYGELSALKARSVVVFLDACFSGATAEGGNLLASARGVAIKPRDTDPQGKMVVFSAASGEQTAFPYEEMGHGMFTYFLLKKLKESKGNATLKELADYVTDNVRQSSVVINRKPQTPTVVPSEAIAEEWQNMKLK